MCGRYYLDDEAIREIQGLVGKENIDQNPGGRWDIHSMDLGIVLWREGKHMEAGWMRWGFPGKQSADLLINARAESVSKSSAFRQSFQSRRCILPAAGFYEWNQKKEKNTFWNPDSPLLYLAGLYDLRENERRFVVLTTQANESMRMIHDRMPLILSKEEIERWIQDEQAAEELLCKVPSKLKRSQEYEQMNFFDL